MFGDEPERRLTTQNPVKARMNKNAVKTSDIVDMGGDKKALFIPLLMSFRLESDNSNSRAELCPKYLDLYLIVTLRVPLRGP
jgi:hypothetical protein